MGIIQEDVRRLDRLISDISDASRLDAELSRAEMDRVDLNGLLSAVADVQQSTSGETGPRIQLELPEDRIIEVNGIEGRLVQVFRNLLANAASFSPPGGTIVLRASMGAGGTRIEVLDDGPGYSVGQGTRHLRALLHRKARGRGIRHPFRPRAQHLAADRRGSRRADLGREPHRRRRNAFRSRGPIRRPASSAI